MEKVDIEENKVKNKKNEGIYYLLFLLFILIAFVFVFIKCFIIDFPKEEISQTKYERLIIIKEHINVAKNSIKDSNEYPTLKESERFKNIISIVNWDLLDNKLEEIKKDKIVTNEEYRDFNKIVEKEWDLYENEFNKKKIEEFKNK